MGKKGRWFSAIRRVFTPSSASKGRLVNESDKKSSKERKGRGIRKHGETKSFIPLFREPSSIEKILGEVDQQNILVRPPTPSDQPITPPILLTRPSSPPPRITSPRAPSQRVTSPKSPSQRVTSPKATSPRASSQRLTSPRAPSHRVTSPRATSPSSQRVISPRAPSQRITSPRATSPRAPSPRVTFPRAPSPRVVKIVRQPSEISCRPEPTLRFCHHSATKIQSAYRGYAARKSFRALRGLVRLQGLVRGQNVRRQTHNAMKQMQLLVRVQTQIQSRRIQMLENQAALQRQAYKSDKELESALKKWTTEALDNEDWDDSVITKEEREARMQRKVEALIKRERAMAYANSHKSWKGNKKSPEQGLQDIHSGGFPWWWNWLERQLPSETQQPTKNTYPTTPSRPSPRPQSNSKISNFAFENLESQTPRSTKSTVPMKTRQMLTPQSKTPPNNSSNLMKFLKPRTSGADSAYDLPLKDDDSLMSCPPFSSSVPNYMSPTVSAKAKMRPNSNPKDRIPGTPSNESERRFSFPLTPNIGSFKWNNNNNNKGTSSKDSTTSQRVLEKYHRSPRSVGEFSMDSAISMPATVGRKPFNRYV